MISTLHLLPVSLGSAPLEQWLPAGARQQASILKTYIAENAKTARAYLKQTGTESAIQDITIHTLGAKTPAADIRRWLTETSGDIGLVSEAGCPAVADPGARVVLMAHQLGIEVVPWVGPSSILLGLMASGLDGQRFTFHGYVPIAPAERGKQLKTWEQLSSRHNQTQLFIETPYRNMAMFATLIEALNPATKLCVARALTTTDEWIRTDTIAGWKRRPQPDLDKFPTLFLFLA
ncbi:MAG TPA: SAM-dependent methyltransferase [Advenella sp.]|nr:SAM-dependent methyltransferase [Advenella sp.]